MMDQESIELSQQVAAKLKPRYRALLGNKRKTDEAFTTTYHEAVLHVSKTLKMSEAKTKFFSRELLQAIMNLVTS